MYTGRPAYTGRIPLFQQGALGAVIFHMVRGKKFDRSDRPNKLSAEVLGRSHRPSFLPCRPRARTLPFFPPTPGARSLPRRGHRNKLIQGCVTPPNRLGDPLKLSDNGRCDDGTPPSTRAKFSLSRLRLAATSRATRRRDREFFYASKFPRSAK